MSESHRRRVVICIYKALDHRNIAVKCLTGNQGLLKSEGETPQSRRRLVPGYPSRGLDADVALLVMFGSPALADAEAHEPKTRK